MTAIIGVLGSRLLRNKARPLPSIPDVEARVVSTKQSRPRRQCRASGDAAAAEDRSRPPLKAQPKAGGFPDMNGSLARPQAAAVGCGCSVHIRGSAMTKWVYSFGEGKADGNQTMRALLG